jgi:hypothetical protein
MRLDEVLAYTCGGGSGDSSNLQCNKMSNVAAAAPAGEREGGLLFVRVVYRHHQGVGPGCRTTLPTILKFAFIIPHQPPPQLMRRRMYRDFALI